MWLSLYQQMVFLHWFISEFATEALQVLIRLSGIPRVDTADAMFVNSFLTGFESCGTYELRNRVVDLGTKVASVHFVMESRMPAASKRTTH
jgi:hypothetical protein